ncbi:hypothetical protein SAY87_030878 [Trapa incisa]|uniref:VQ domain-containing protein n=1 Tax=Trapa incisa TaxID=236973 RepID=A0AAN7KW05_9MYRT|nr:hypothetical protein SAY87_030878 [Trapa incisa]
MDNSKNTHSNDHLGVNKIGKNIKKSPLHQPNFANTNSTAVNNPARQQPQPRVYNISKNDFRNIVQQLTGSPSQDLSPRPHGNAPKSQTRLQKIRPPPLPFSSPLIPPQASVPAPQPPLPFLPNSLPIPPQFGIQPPSNAPVPSVVGTGDPYLCNPTFSPVSSYMHYLQTSLLDPSPSGNQHTPPTHPQQQPLVSSGMLPNNPPPAFQHMNVPPPLPSPTSQFLLPSPSNYLNLLSPRSPYPLLSPGVQFPPLSPSFSFSPIAQSGILVPGPQPLPSPGLMFPLSPSGFFTIPSPGGGINSKCGNAV